MALSLKRPEDVGRSLVQGLVSELGALLRLVTSTAATSAARRDETVHQVRKRLKRLRALLRLLRHALGPEEYRRENLALRDAARPLAEVRDAKVFVETIQRLARRGSPRGPAARQLAPVAEGLAERHRDLAERILGAERAFETVAATLAAVRARAERWTLDADGWKLLEPGFERAYRRGERARGHARREGTSEALHEWRKEVKYLLYQLQIIEPAWRAAERALSRRLDRLADLLGEDHDLAVVAATVTDPALQRLLARRRATLQRQAFTIGRLVYARRPAAAVRALRDAWHDWRA